VSVQNKLAINTHTIIMLDCLQQTIDRVTDYVGLKAIPSLLTLPEEKNAVLLDVPSYSQCDSYSCGATAAWSIVEIFHPRANFWKLYKAVSPDEDEGVGTRRVLQALHKFNVDRHWKRPRGSGRRSLERVVRLWDPSSAGLPG
jgi:hypothetical protein